MARGWESKSVESQIESAESRRSSAQTKLTPEQIRVKSERESLELQRSRVLRDMSTASNPRYREQLQRSLAFLDEKLRALE